METVGATPGQHVNDAARCASIFRREVTRDDTKLPNSIQRNVMAEGRIVDVVVINAVQQHVSACSALAVDVEARSATRDAHTWDCRAGIVIGDIVRNSDQVIWVSRQRRQLTNLRACDDVRNLRSLSIHLDALSGDHTDRLSCYL